MVTISMDRKKVLIIDDEIDLCMLLKSYFVKRNYDVTLSHTITDGLNKLEAEQPEILFLDSNLPDGIGWNMAPMIAAKNPQIEINLISAFHGTPPQMPAVANYAVYEKPISFADLDKKYFMKTA